MPTHRIQLKGPWEVRRLDQDKPPTRVFMPASWVAIFGEESGRAEFRRKFNQPTNLESHEQVWVVFDGVGGEGLFRINGQIIGSISAPTAEFEITRQLSLHNELIVELTVFADRASDPQSGLWGLVTLEIRSET